MAAALTQTSHGSKGVGSQREMDTETKLKERKTEKQKRDVQTDSEISQGQSLLWTQMINRDMSNFILSEGHCLLFSLCTLLHFTVYCFIII